MFIVQSFHKHMLTYAITTDVRAVEGWGYMKSWGNRLYYEKSA